ncbi:hypothetical protein GCK32_020361 [Trichostrongylus colubriformis]|uniref:Uncharacterized protein n=1 Tax=Trichostrongylus colubriformis TaxID=6319 RepID=A0AAN8FAP1_TRICO
MSYFRESKIVLSNFLQESQSTHEATSNPEKLKSDNSEKSLQLHTPEKSDSTPRIDTVLQMDGSLEKALADLEKEDWYHGYLPVES